MDYTPLIAKKFAAVLERGLSRKKRAWQSLSQTRLASSLLAGSVPWLGSNLLENGHYEQINSVGEEIWNAQTASAVREQFRQSGVESWRASADFVDEHVRAWAKQLDDAYAKLCQRRQAPRYETLVARPFSIEDTTR